MRDEFEEEFEQHESPRPRRRERVRRPLIEVLSQDADLVVVNKPPGLAAGLEGQTGETVIDQLSAELGVSPASIRLVDRADEGLSGVMVVARTADAHRHLTRQYMHGTVEKGYLAIVRGAVLSPSGAINIDIGPDKQRPGRLRIGSSQARPAVTEWKLRDQFAGFALVECRPAKERGDQVRLHLQTAGMPLAVDPEYGGAANLMLSSFKPDYRQSRRREERPLIARLSLHVLSLSYVHPRTGETCRFKVGPPKDFRAALNQLDKHGRIGIPPKSRF